MSQKSLADILRKSKAIMGHDSLAIKENSQDKPNPDFKVPVELQESLSTNNRPINEETIRKSNLPDFIKESMINNPINIPNPYNVEDNPEYSDLIEPNYQNTSQRVNESISMNSGLSESTIRLIIKDEIGKALKDIKTPVISENQIKSTMIKMIREGKLTIKKKLN